MISFTSDLGVRSIIFDFLALFFSVPEFYLLAYKFGTTEIALETLRAPIACPNYELSSV